MRTKKMIQLVCIALFTASMGFAAGGPRGEMGPPVPPPPGGEMRHSDIMAPGLKMRYLGILLEDSHILDELGLSKSTVKKIQSLLTENKKFNIKKKAEKAVLYIDLQNEMEKEKINIAQVKDLAGQINQISSDIFLRNITDNASALNLLTPEQKSQLKEISEDHRAHILKNFKKDIRRHRKLKKRK